MHIIYTHIYKNTNRYTYINTYIHTYVDRQSDTDTSKLIGLFLQPLAVYSTCQKWVTLRYSVFAFRCLDYFHSQSTPRTQSHNISLYNVSIFWSSGFRLSDLSLSDACESESESSRCMCYHISVKRLREYFEYTTCVLLFGAMEMFVRGMWHLLSYLVL
jgi:hypothetical protein